MLVRSLSLSNFRNYSKTKIDLSPSVNIFIGNNAAGKTNILESLYVLSSTKSYKAKDKEMIKLGEQFYRLNAQVEHRDYEENLMLIGAENGRSLLSNGAAVKRNADFVGRLSVVLFSPDDILMFKNGPSEKRKLMNMSLLQLSKEYVDDYTAFNNQLKVRGEYLKNILLKKYHGEEEIVDPMLDVLTENFISCNQKIYESRAKFTSRLERIVEAKYRMLSGENCEIKISYLVNFETNPEKAMEFFQKRYLSDVQRGTTQYGIQRDDLKFLKNGLDFETNCSQGEQRMLALSIRLAVSEMIREVKKEAPVVLLDDVFSELDNNHQNRLLSMLDRSMQIIITTTDIQKIGSSALRGAKVFVIENGNVKETRQNG